MVQNIKINILVYLIGDNYAYELEVTRTSATMHIQEAELGPDTSFKHFAHDNIAQY